MSHEAIAAAMARDDLSCGERLVAFSLASYADRENRAFPGTVAAAGRAGLEKSRYLEARGELVRRGLVVVEHQARGRGRATTLALLFAATGPWWDGEINAEMFEAVLAYSQTQGSSRLLLASFAALADERGVVECVSLDQLCKAAGVAERTYRRAKKPLLASGELVLRCARRGRGNTNTWEIPHPRSRGTSSPRPRQPAARFGGAPPLVASVPSIPGVCSSTSPQSAHLSSFTSGPSGGKGGQHRTVSTQNRPTLTAKPSQARTPAAHNGAGLAGAPPAKPGQDRTRWNQNPAQNPAETPAPNARAGREPQNPRTVDPPSPPEGGSVTRELLVEETYVTERGRKRRRMVRVDVVAVRDRLATAGGGDREAWEQIRGLLLEGVGKSTFELWLARLELVAVDCDGSLVIDAPVATRGWVVKRFSRLLERCAARAGRVVRFASEHERLALVQRPGDVPVALSREQDPAAPVAGARALRNRRVASVSSARVGRASADSSTGGSTSAPSPSGDWRSDQSSSGLSYRSADDSSYVQVYTGPEEVS